MRCDLMEVFQLGETPGSQLLAPGTGFFLHARALFEFFFIIHFLDLQVQHRHHHFHREEC
jgi:hypothetical protein